MGAVYQMEYQVRISDCDASGRLRPSALMIELQEVGEAHAASYGLSRTELLEDGMCWVLYRQRTVVRALPRFTETLRLTTWPGAIHGPVFPRCFSLETADGVPVGAAVSAWVLMDIHTRRPLRPTAIRHEVPAVTDRDLPVPLPGMLRIDGADAIGARIVQYSDVDVNGHMTNTRYVDWLCDVLPYDALASRGLADWQINYIAEARPGEKLQLFTKDDGGATLLSGKRDDGKTVFEARAEML